MNVITFPLSEIDRQFIELKRQQEAIRTQTRQIERNSNMVKDKKPMKSPGRGIDRLGGHGKRPVPWKTSQKPKKPGRSKKPVLPQNKPKNVSDAAWAAMLKHAGRT